MKYMLSIAQRLTDGIRNILLYSSYTTCKVVEYYLNMNSNHYKMYIVKSNVATIHILQRGIINYSRQRIKYNKKDSIKLGEDRKIKKKPRMNGTNIKQLARKLAFSLTISIKLKFLHWSAIVVY